MAEPWSAPPGDDNVPAPASQQVDRYALQSTLADLVRRGDGAKEPGARREPTPGPTGHQALAALAAEVAQAAAGAPVEVDAEPDSDSARRAPNGEPRTGPAGFPKVRARPFGGTAAADPSSSGPGAGNGTPIDVAAAGRRPVGRLRTGSGLNPSGAVQLSPEVRSAPAAPVDQATIALRRRPVASGPVSVAAAPPDPGHETTPPPATTAASRSLVDLEGWSPADDDILPRRQIRRGRSLRRTR